MTAERNPDDSRPGVVGLGQVASFDPGVQPRPDTLEGAVAQAAVQASAGGIAPAAPLQKIAAAIREHFQWLRIQQRTNDFDPRFVPDSAKLPDYMDSYLPLLLFLDHDNEDRMVQYRMRKILVGQLVPAIENAYGDFFFETDIGAALGIDRNRPNEFIEVNAIASYFPELGQLVQLTGKNMNLAMVWNPYLTLLSLPADKRAFLAGTLEVAEGRGVWKASPAAGTVTWSGAVDGLRAVVTLPDILTYAKQVGEKQVKQYLDALQGLK